MGDDEYSIPKGILSQADRRHKAVGTCISCGHELPDDETQVTEVPRCPICGASQISDAAGDWLETELN